jgi:hypothetical protein
MILKRAKRPNIHFYAVFDHHSRQLSAGMAYKKALKAKRFIQDMSRVGILQAIVAVPPFRVKKLETIRR